MTHSTKDGIVTGTTGDDVIKDGYVDHNGDEIDGGDAILPGEVGDDDIVVSGQGDDYIESGAGDDEVYAGAGDDTVHGGAGDDEIFGDSDGGYASGDGREVFQWDQAPNYGDEVDAAGFTQNTGSVDVTFEVYKVNDDAEVEYEDNAGNVSDIDTGGLGPVDPNSGLALEGDDKKDDAEVKLHFSDAVENVEFRINDIDFDSTVKIYAYDADGNKIDVNLTGGCGVKVDGHYVISQDANQAPTGDDNSVLVEIPGPVASIKIKHDVTGDDTSHIQLTDVYFDSLGGIGGGDPGDDTLFGGDGDDYIDGGDGDDVIYGDNGGAGGSATVRESFEWDQLSEGEIDSTATQDTGEVTVTYTRLNDTGDHESELGTDELNVSGIDTGGETIDTDSSLQSTTNGEGNEGDFQWEFSQPVENVEFNVNDIDGDGVVRITAYDDAGNKIPVELVGGAKLTLLDTDSVAGADTADSDGGYDDTDTDPYNLQVTIPGPVARIVLEHDQDGGGNSGINVTDMYYDVTVPDGGDPGDDTLIGGLGADEMYGEDGDDVFIVDSAEQGTGDVIVGGNGPDDTTDHDVLDLTGAGKVTINATADATDAGATTGTVTFEDTGETLEFSQIEEILTDHQNSDPDAQDDTATTGQDTAVIIDVLDNDSDPDGDPLTVTEATSPDGTVTINGDGTITFDPTPGFNGETTVDYTVSDGNGGTDSAVVTLMVRDGIVEGTTGDDLIDIDYTGDPEGDMVDHDDAVLPGEGPNDDIILAYDGDDTVYAGEGDDEVYGGPGDDTIYGEAGDDVLIGGDGSDTVEGGEGDDFIDTSGSAPASDYGADLPDPYPDIPEDADKTNDLDFVDGGAGNDTIFTGDDADVILGGTGDDRIDGGLDDDVIEGGEGDDFIIGGHGSDSIDGGAGNDEIWGGLGAGTDLLNIEDEDDPDLGIDDPRPDNGIDIIDGGAGDDTIYGQDDDDVLLGGAGNDYIDGGIDEDVIEGGEGDDTLLGGIGDDVIIGGEGADTIYGGDGRDTIIGGDDGDVVDGGTGGDGDDYDVLNLATNTPIRIVNETTDADGDSTSGTIQFLDGSGNVTGSMDFFEIEKIIPCFTPGSMIATPKGEVPVETLKAGDRVITRDNGIQEIAWVGRKDLGFKEIAANEHLRPVLIRAGALGNGLPERDMMVSPNHRMLVANDRTALYFDEREVLAAAKHLVDSSRIMTVEPMGVSYIHFMFEHHEVVLSDGAWTESFQPGDYSLKGVGNAQRQEIFELFPELESRAGLEDYTAARRILKKHEAQMLMK